MVKKVTVVLNCNIEERLRAYTGRKGELSKISNEAFALWLDVKEGKKIVNCVQTEEGKKP